MKLCSRHTVRSRALHQRPTVPPPPTVLRSGDSSCGKMGTYTKFICTDTKKLARTHSTSTQQEDQTFNQTSSATAPPKQGATTVAVAPHTPSTVHYNISVLTAQQAQQPHRVTALRHRISSPQLRDDCPDTLETVSDNV